MSHAQKTNAKEPADTPNECHAESEHNEVRRQLLEMIRRNERLRRAETRD
jgi:hypothetical protein